MSDFDRPPMQRLHRVLWSCTLAAALGACADGRLPGDATHDSPPPPAPGAAECPTRIDTARFASAEQLFEQHRFLDSLKARPTASPSHTAFVDWLDTELAAIPGLQRRNIAYDIDRWLERTATLDAGPAAAALAPVRVSGAVPYSLPTPAAGVSAPLLYVPLATAISSIDVRGRIVLREAATASVPRAAFAALEWWSYDPDLTLTAGIAGDYERDFLAYEQRITDLREAGAGGAAGLIL